MTLLKTTTEVKKYCSVVDLNLSIDSLESYKRKAERYVKECLGTALYNSLTIAYESGNALVAPNIALLPYVQDPLVNITMYMWLNAGQMSVSDVGVQIDHSGEKKTAFQWQIDAWKEDLEAAGFDALDDLLTFLEDNKAIYTTWASDTGAFTLNKEFFNPDAVSFSKIVDIGNSRRTFKKLAQYMTLAHDTQLRPNLGDDFYDELKAALAGDTLTTDQNILVPYLKKCEVYFALAQAYGPLRFVMKGNGIRVYETLSSIENADTQKTVTSLDAEANRMQMEEMGKFYLKALLKYLNEHAATYATWLNGDKYVDPDTAAVEGNYYGDGIVGIF